MRALLSVVLIAALMLPFARAGLAEPDTSAGGDSCQHAMPEIELDATIWSVNNLKAKQLGLQLPSAINAYVGTFVPDVGPSAATPAPLLAGKIVTTAGPLFSDQLRALLQQGAAEAISRPRLETLNGRMAVIDLNRIHLELIPTVNVDGSIAIYTHIGQPETTATYRLSAGQILYIGGLTDSDNSDAKDRLQSSITIGITAKLLDNGLLCGSSTRGEPTH
jgi:hypothetical protein